ncbi:ankyrin repeat, PH and SEC7 domain containing protein secG-like isoform X1 [Argonauta hians]
MTMENIDSNDWNSEKEHVLKTDYPLHFACREGDVDQLRRLLDQYTATAVSSVDLTKAILCKEDSFYGWTPAHWAAYFGKLACLQKLACFNRPNNLKCDMRNSKFQQTPSHVAAYAGHPHCLQWLLQSEADINACDYLGETPLHKAASTGSLDCVSLLISYEATLGIKNSNGETACSVARRSGFQECARNLEMSNITSGIVTSATIPDTTMEVQPSVSLQEKTQTDILMDKDVKKNQKSVGGRKRTMEDLDEGIFKYLRQGEVERNSHSLDHLNEVDRGILDSFKAVLSISTDPLNYDPETYPFLVNEPASNCTHTGIFQ